MDNTTVEAKIINDNSEEHLAAVTGAKGAILEALGLTVERYAKEKCPVDTGRLKNSIAHTADQEYAYCGTNVEYAPYVEMGHHTPSGKFVQPKPYLKPAVTDHTQEYINIIKAHMPQP